MLNGNEYQVCSSIDGGGNVKMPQPRHCKIVHDHKQNTGKNSIKCIANLHWDLEQEPEEWSSENTGQYE
jgi:hypothetical protein